jgi:tRNA threonylcarbamoyl adenosine modification protein (Sua5/YciO/YrdC/YwlC family)
MIEYVVPGNIDDRVLERGARILREGGLAALPTDTSWSVVCSLMSREGIRKLRRLSGERDERHFTLLCADISQFGEFCSLDNTRFRLIKRLSPGPYVFILGTLLGTEKSLGSDRGLRRRELGVRLPAHPIPLALIKTLGAPLYSVTAKRGMIAGEEAGGGEEESSGEEDGLPPIREEELFEGGWELEAIEGLDLIIDGGEERPRIFSTILDLSAGEARLIRQGAGAWPA